MHYYPPSLRRPKQWAVLTSKQLISRLRALTMDRPPQTLRLIIVDDDAKTRSALAAYMTGLQGVSIVGEALDGQDALELLESRAADVVLLDCHMPRLTGPEATRRLKERWPEIKVIIFTIYPDCKAQAEAAGADAVLTKGCTSEEMSSTLWSVATA
jgi:CheY-like chemotaxis protein